MATKVKKPGSTPKTTRQIREDASTALLRTFSFWTPEAGGGGRAAPPTPAPGAMPQYAGLTSAQELAGRQAEADAQARARAARSSMSGLTIRTALEDLREVVVGIPADLFGQSGDLALRDLLARNDRLRGLGVLLVSLSILAFALLW